MSDNRLISKFPGIKTLTSDNLLRRPGYIQVGYIKHFDDR
jgi:hypothetical protein